MSLTFDAAYTTVFVSPDVYALAETVARLDDISVAEVARIACVRAQGAGGPKAQLPERGRTRRLKLRAHPVIKAMFRKAAQAANVPLSAWIAAAVEDHVHHRLAEICDAQARDEAQRLALRQIQADIDAGRYL
jgi:hypothetical protein